jgi:hypothetical protein
MNHLTNVVFEAQGLIDMNSNNAISIPSGLDKLAKINEPDGAGRSKASLEELYQQSIEANF